MEEFDMDNYDENEQDSPNEIQGLIGKLLAPLLTAFSAVIFVHIVDKKREKKAVIEAYEKGIAEASQIYETKLRRLTEAFLNKELEWQENKAEYEELIREYDNEIAELTKRREKEKDDRNEILFLKAKRKKLKKLNDYA